MELADNHLFTVVCWRHGKVGAGATACLVARLDGGPHADLRTDPCSHHGDSWDFHGGADVAVVRTVADGIVGGFDYWRCYGNLDGVGRAGAERYQAGRRIFDIVTARVYDRGAWRLCLFDSHIPPRNPRVLQGFTVPRSWICDHCAAS